MFFHFTSCDQCKKKSKKQFISNCSEIENDNIHAAAVDVIDELVNKDLVAPDQISKQHGEEFINIFVPFIITNSSNLEADSKMTREIHEIIIQKKVS